MCLGPRSPRSPHEEYSQAMADMEAEALSQLEQEMDSPANENDDDSIDDDEDVLNQYRHALGAPLPFCTLVPVSERRVRQIRTAFHMGLTRCADYVARANNEAFTSRVSSHAMDLMVLTIGSTLLDTERRRVPFEEIHYCAYVVNFFLVVFAPSLSAAALNMQRMVRFLGLRCGMTESVAMALLSRQFAPSHADRDIRRAMDYDIRVPGFDEMDPESQVVPRRVRNGGAPVRFSAVRRRLFEPVQHEDVTVATANSTAYESAGTSEDHDPEYEEI